MKRQRVQAIDVGAKAPWPADVPQFRAVTADRLRVALSEVARDGRALNAAPGQTVRRGERLTDPSARHSATVYAPADGRIGELSSVTLSSGQQVPAVEFQVTGEVCPPVAIDDPSRHALGAGDGVKGAGRFAGTSPNELGVWIDRMIDCGVDAHRMGCPDLLGQLMAALRRPIDSVICSLLPVDDHLRLGAVLAYRYHREIVAAVALLSMLSGAQNRWIIAEAGTPPQWARPLREAVNSEQLRLLWMQHDYPLDDPSVLLYALLGRKLRPGRLPTDRGVILLDAPAAMALGRCALLSEPTLATPVVLRDHRRDEIYHLWAAPGTSLHDILSVMGISPSTVQLRIGHLLRNKMISDQTVVGHGENVFQLMAHRPARASQACIRCGWCIDACPVNIQPAMLLEAAQRNNASLAGRAGLDACIECGICDYVCPSELPILSAIRKLRSDDE